LPAEKKALSVGVVANAIDPAGTAAQPQNPRGPLTDQTKRARPAGRLCARRSRLKAAAGLRKKKSGKYQKLSLASMARHGAGHARAAEGCAAKTFDYGNNSASARSTGREARPSNFPRLRAGLHPTQFCTARGPFRWVACRRPADISSATDRALLELFPPCMKALHRWLKLAANASPVQGLPAAHLLARTR